MSDQIKVGSICIGQNFGVFQEYNGMECEVIGELAPRRSKNNLTGIIDTDYRYRVVWANGQKRCAKPFYLRLKKPPQDIISWADEKVKGITRLIPTFEKETA